MYFGVDEQQLLSGTKRAGIVACSDVKNYVDTLELCELLARKRPTGKASLKGLHR